MNKKKHPALYFFSLILGITAIVHAEDTEIFTTIDNPDASFVCY